jgi:DNA-binding MarR family transcriptional regulator
MTRAAEREVWQAMRALVLDRYDRRREVVEALDMSFVRVKALRHIAAGPVPMADLVIALGTDRPYTTIVVDDLERRGFVTRSPHPDDGRAKIVSATPDGRRVARKAASILERPPAAIAELSDRDLAELHRLLDLL